MARTYVLLCADGSYYVGSTTYLEARLWQHNHGPDGPVYTRRRRPVRLVWSGEFATAPEASAFEKLPGLDVCRGSFRDPREPQTGTLTGAASMSPVRRITCQRRRMPYIALATDWITTRYISCR